MENKGAKGRGWCSFREVPAASEAMAEGQATQGKATEQEQEVKTQEAETVMLQTTPCQEQEVEVQQQIAQGRVIVITVVKKGIGQESAHI